MDGMDPEKDRRDEGNENIPRQKSDQPKHKQTIQEMQDQAGQMIAEGVHSPQNEVKAEGQPGQRNVVSETDRGEHPAQMGPAEAAVMRIRQKINVVVPIQESAAQNAGENDKSEQSDRRRH